MKSVKAMFFRALPAVIGLVLLSGCPDSGDDHDYLIEYAAHGTYGYDDGAGTLTLEITVSSFPKCGGFAEGKHVFTVDHLDETTMILDQGTDDEMLWTRKAGDPNDLAGEWAYHDPDDKAAYVIILRADNSLTITSTDLDCAG